MTTTPTDPQEALKEKLRDIICFGTSLPIGYDARWGRSDAEDGVTAIMEAIEEQQCGDETSGSDHDRQETYCYTCVLPKGHGGLASNA